MDKNFFNRKAEKVAKELLGKILNVNGKKIRIVETEAYYGEEDPASRARQNGDLRKTMLMSGGTILVYGCHDNWLINIVTNKKGKAEAVLIRSGQPLNFKANTKGPGLLTKALRVDKSFHKSKIGEKILINFDRKNVKIGKSFRIGVKKDLSRKLRFYIKDNKHVSK